MTQGLPPGTLLNHNQYRIEKVLGQGGFGITYLAHDFSLDRKVAIKEFFPKEFCDRDSDATCLTSGTNGHSEYVRKLKDKFLNEARHIGRLNHPNIIKIHSAFEENNTAYYVMEYIEGENLSEKVKRNGPLKEEVAIDFIEKVGDALEYMHKRKFNHLDVKPANIMVECSSNSPILIDFGLSTHYETGEELPTGTMPPGISNGYSPLALYDFNRDKSFNPQHDVYSLAATLYYLVSGVTPPSAVQLSSSALAFHSNFPEILKEPIKKGMAITSENRYSSVQNFINKISPEKDPEPVFAGNTITRQIVGNTDKEGLYINLNNKKIKISASLNSLFDIPIKGLSIFLFLITLLVLGGLIKNITESSGGHYTWWQITFIIVLFTSSILFFYSIINIGRLYKRYVNLLYISLIGFSILGLYLVANGVFKGGNNILNDFSDVHIIFKIIIWVMFIFNLILSFALFVYGPISIILVIRKKLKLINHYFVESKEEWIFLFLLPILFVGLISLLVVLWLS